MKSADHNKASRTALVTGAAKRIGRALALSLAQRGMDVVIHYLSSSEGAESLADEIGQLGRRAWLLKADLADVAAVECLMGRAIEAAGPVDVLINNASIFPDDHVRDFSADDLMLSVQIHAYAPLALSRAMAAQGRPGNIVNLLDCRMVDYDRQHATYHLSKRMLFALTRILALEFAPAIRVNGVAPGLILPPEGQDQSYLDKLAHTTPLRRHGSPDDVISAIFFLLDSPFITGQVIYVDGGRNLKGRMYD